MLVFVHVRMVGLEAAMLQPWTNISHHIFLIPQGYISARIKFPFRHGTTTMNDLDDLPDKLIRFRGEEELQSFAQCFS